MSHHHVEHKHEQTPLLFNRAFLIAVLTNGLFVLLQIIFAFITNSNSLLADGIHNLGDVLGLILAWMANVMLGKKPTDRSTFGMKKTTILAAFANGSLLIFTCGVIATEAIYKLFSPGEMQAIGVMIVAGIGVFINGATALLFIGGRDDLNIKGAYLHLLYDALVSVGVVVTAVVIYFTNWYWLDPLVGLLIAGIIIKGSWGLFKDSFRLMIDGVPREISLPEVRQYLESISGVDEIHDLHIWGISTQENALSVHLVMPNDPLDDKKRASISEDFKALFNIHHVTMQVEKSSSFCEDRCQKFL
tara:strand:- start:572 stop:1480 length:909 start_codon:yes stop_codon:yes gene_type:complete